MDARSLFFEFVVRQGPDDDASFQALCEQHPSAAAELGELRAAFLRGRQMVVQAQRDEAWQPPAEGPSAVSAPAPADLERSDVDDVVRRLQRRTHDVRASTTGLPDPAAHVTSDAGRRRASDAGGQEALIDEARRLAALEHPGIPAVHGLELDSEERLSYLVARTQGAPLADIAGSDRARAIDAAVEAVEIVAFAHERGVAHGALTLDRLRIGTHGNVTVTGWEAASPASPTSLRRDLRALAKILDRIAAPQRPRELRAILSAAGDDGDGLYSSATELAHDLHAWLDERVVRADAGGPFTALVKWTRRNRWVSAGTVVFLVLAGIGLAVYSTAAAQARDRAHVARDQADAQRARAEDQSRASRERLDRIELATLPEVVDALRAEADELWPATPGNEQRLRNWISEASLVAARVDDVRAVLERLRANGRLDDEPRGAPVEGTPEHLLAEARALLQRRRATLEKLRASSNPAASVSARFVGWSEHEVAWREERADARGAIRFEDTPEQSAIDLARQERLWTDVRDALVAFAEGDYHSPDQSPRFGTSLPALQARLESIEELAAFSRSDEVRNRWDAALAAIAAADGPYGGLQLVAAPDLVPLGPDPDSGLWEFWHVPSGSEPPTDADGRRTLTPEAGLVLVLIPGGTTVQGAQKDDPDGVGYAPDAADSDLPAHEVRLDPFFLSKFELTQEQWLRATGTVPSHYKPGGFGADWTNPVERINYAETRTTLRRLGLELPTEAQWEHAARGGQRVRNATEDILARLEGTANLADVSLSRATGQDPGVDFDDGFIVHAPVGSYAPNAFGLHDTIGNVAEWCRDAYGRYTGSTQAGDGLRVPESSNGFVERGASFLSPASEANARVRRWLRGDSRTYFLGCRPARRLDLGTAP